MIKIRKNSEIGMKTARRMQERAKQKQKRELKKKEKKERTEAEEERLDYAGFILSRKWDYHKLMLASDVNKARIEGREVHGFMERVFSDYDWLIENDVMDRACYFAYKHPKPVVHNLVNNFDFDKMNLSLVLLPKFEHFDHYSELEYNRVLFFSEHPLRKDLTWISNYEWETDDGYNTTVNYAPCNLLNMGSPLHDLPLVVVKDAVGKSSLFFKAKTTAEDLTKQRDEIIRNQLFKIRDKQKSTEDLIDELKIESAGARKKYSDLKKKMLSRDPSTTEEKFRRWEKTYDRRQSISNIDTRKLIIRLIAIFAVIMLIMVLIFLFSTKPPNSSDELQTSVGVLNILRRGY
ncbi:MAG: hypothetical protein ACFFDF_01065 [Candidatus Odinarchaeota archaeon]